MLVGSKGADQDQIAYGTLMRCLSPSMASGCILGALLMMKERFWKFWFSSEISLHTRLYLQSILCETALISCKTLQQFRDEAMSEWRYVSMAG